MVQAKIVRIDSEKREISLHIGENFPIGIVEGVFSPLTFEYIDWHWHEELQYNVVLDGDITFQIANDVLTLTKGEGLFINSEKLHRIETSSNSSTSLMIYFPSRLISNQKEDYLYKTYVSPLISYSQIDYMVLRESDKNQKALITQLKELNQLYTQKNPYYELDMLAKVIDIWKHTLLYQDQKLDYNLDNDLVDQRLKTIFSFITERYSDQISLEDIAESVHLSRSECCRLFKKAVNQNLFQYLMNYRINKAVDYLLYTDDSIANVAYSVGFNSQSYFTKCFSAVKSITPSRLRTQFRNKTIDHL